MATEYSFDIVSKLNIPELENAINQTRKEVKTRFDFKDAGPIIEKREKSIILQCNNKLQLKSMRDVFETKLARRKVSTRFFEYGKEENTSKGASKQELAFKEGIDKEEAKRLVQLIKKSGLKVKTQIQEDQLKVTSRDKDELQKIIKLAKDNESVVPFQFVNYR